VKKNDDVVKDNNDIPRKQPQRYKQDNLQQSEEALCSSKKKKKKRNADDA
jgi:hypothetical protein